MRRPTNCSQQYTHILHYQLYFHLLPLSLLSFCQHLDLLLSQISGIVMKHTEVTVLEACANLTSTLCSDSYTFSSRANLAFSQLMDSLTECFSSYLSELMQVGEFIAVLLCQTTAVLGKLTQTSNSVFGAVEVPVHLFVLH